MSESVKETIIKILNEGLGGRFDRTGPAMAKNSGDVETAAKEKFGAKKAVLTRQGRMEFPTKDRREALKIHAELLKAGFTAGKVEIDKSYSQKNKEWTWIVYHTYKIENSRKKENGFVTAQIDLYDNYRIGKGEIIPKRDPGDNEIARGIPVSYGKQ